MRIYPYAQRDDPPPTRIVSPDGRAWSGDQPRGLAYWERLHDIYQSEIVDERDRFYLAMLKQLGIEKGMPFAPDDRLRRILETQPPPASSWRRPTPSSSGSPGRGLAGPPVGPRHRARQLGTARRAPRRAARARVLVLRGGQLLRRDEEPDARGRAGVPRLLRGHRRRVAGRRPGLHAARPGGPAREAVLVGDGLRRRHALPDRQPAGPRRPRLTRPGRRQQRRRVRRPVLRAPAAGRRATRTGCRPSRAATGSPTSASTDRSRPTSTAAGSSATSRPPRPPRPARASATPRAPRTSGRSADLRGAPRTGRSR